MSWFLKKKEEKEKKKRRRRKGKREGEEKKIIWCTEIEFEILLLIISPVEFED